MNEYTPWVDLGITETEYFKKRYLEMRQALEVAREALESIKSYWKHNPFVSSGEDARRWTKQDADAALEKLEKLGIE